MDAYSLFQFDSNRKINRKAGCSVKPIVGDKANQKAPLRKGSCPEGAEGLITLHQSIYITNKRNGNPTGLSGHLPLHKGGVFLCGKGDCVKKANQKASPGGEAVTEGN